jgi:hypothetical protein
MNLTDVNTLMVGIIYCLLKGVKSFIRRTQELTTSQVTMSVYSPSVLYVIKPESKTGPNNILIFPDISLFNLQMNSRDKTHTE